MNILVSGCAGFIGYSFIKKIITNNKYKVLGFDNLNKYYSIKLKKKRLNELKKNKNFIFKKIDLLDKKKIKELFIKNKFDIIFHFAAQAGVRYVVSNPEKFIDSNIMGFHNLINISKNYKIKKFFYASSSSVYGEKNKFPVDETSKLNPKNIYGLSKKLNEEYININSSNFTKYIGLRFFTVYGEWGRPDMMFFKLLDAAYKKKPFYLNNKGNHWRDFTYIDDVVNILEILLKKNYRSNQIFNICRGKPIYIKNLVNLISKKISYTGVKNTNSNKFEVQKTHGKNNKVLRFTRFKDFTNIYSKLDDIIEWYKQFRHLI